MRVSLIIFTVVCIISANIVFAENYAGELDVNRIYVSGETCFFGVIGEISNTCDFWGERFKFSISNTQGKAMLSLLLSAKLSGKKIDVWYNNSSTPGTDQTNGCTFDTIAVATRIGIK